MTKIKKDELKELFAVLDLYGVNLHNIKIARDTVGFVNKIYFVTVGKQKFVLRKSKPITSLAHIKLEVELLEDLATRKFAATPKIIRNLKGKDITLYNKTFFTLQTFMPGGVKASWNDISGFTKKRVNNFFKTVAVFGKAVNKFIAGKNFANKPLWYFVKNGPGIFNKLYNNLPSSAGKKLVFKNYLAILKFIAQTRKEFTRTGYDNLPKQLVHFDFHPGNVNFIGEQVVAIFDFDWARYDARFSDLASAIDQSCYYYGGQRGGQFKKALVKQAVSSYQRAFGRSKFSREKEYEYIKVALRGYAVYIFFWAVDLYEKNPTRENFSVLDHFLKMLLINDYDRLLI